MPIDTGVPVYDDKGRRVPNLTHLGGERYRLRREVDGRTHKPIFVAKNKTAAIDYRNQVCNTQGEQALVVNREITFDDFVAELETLARAAGKQSESTIDLYLLRYRINVKPKYGHTRLYKFTPQKCSAIYNEMRSNGWVDDNRKMTGKYSENTINQTEAALMWILGAACSSDFGYLQKNVAREVGLAKPRAVAKSVAIGWNYECYFKEGEVAKLLAQLERNPILWNACFFARMTGLRIGEVLAMKVKNLRSLHHKIVVEWQLTEGRVGAGYRESIVERHGEEAAPPEARPGDYGLRPLKADNWVRRTHVRQVPMTPQLHKQLNEVYIPWLIEKEMYDEDGYLFPNRNTLGPLCPSVVGKAFREALVRAGIKRKGIVFHSFRHTYATQLLAQKTDVDLKEVARNLGHDVEVLKAVYEHHIHTPESDAAFRDVALNTTAFAL